MRKIVISILFLLLLPNIVSSADDLIINTDTNIHLDGSDIDLILKAGSKADSMTVNPTSIQFTLSANSSVILTNAKRRDLSNSLGASTDCGTSVSSVTLPAQDTSTSVTVTPSATVYCGGTGSSVSTDGGGGGGGAATTSTMPTTTTGEVTATAAGGGKTTLTTAENITASVELSANAVSANTAVKVASEEKAEVTASRSLPTGKGVVGGYVFNYTAEANSQAVSSFANTITLTFTYAEQQVSDLDESTLRVFYWKEADSQWVALPTTINASTNTLTATTDHFTYFAILGTELDAEEVEDVVEEGVAIVDGDLVRNPNAEGMAQFDIYIVKLVGSKKFKRLILSPHVFESYEHFDKNGNGSPWDDVQDVAQSVMDEYTTSDLVRAVGDAKVYKLTPTGDTGTKQWLNMTAAEFVSQDYDSDSIYEINVTDRNAYTTGAEIGEGGATAGETILIKIDSLRVRSLPSLDGDILTNVNEGEVYDLLDEQDGWYKITANGATGWVYGGDTDSYAAKQ